MSDEIIRMRELIEILNNASKLYYQYNTTIMTDFEYDKLYDELVNLEKSTGMTLSNSPTINVEPEILSTLEQVEHPAPMLSLAKTKMVDELKGFLGDKEGLLSWKLDGLTIVLTYENGKLVSGVTRGTGLIGEVVTGNVKQFKNVPLTIPFMGHLVLRGEAIITYSDFQEMNKIKGSGSSQYKNPRNLCSGSVRQLDSHITAERNVNCIIFSLIEGKQFTKKSDAFSWLESLGFEVVEHKLVNENNLEEKVLEYKKRVSKYNIPSDGLVLTYDDIEYSDSLGSTAKFPRHSLAFKWKDETAETILNGVDWKVSRTGLINPVAMFDPVELEGTIVSRASLHNLSILKGLKLGIGDRILVYKANMIIPQLADNLTRSDNLDIPDKCPVCNHNTNIVSSNDVDYLYCSNEYCIAKLAKRLSLFVSRNGMNIEGISDAIITKLVDEGMVKNYSDLYHLDNYKERIICFNGFGEKAYGNLISSIEKSRNVKIANFIYALGIPEVGLSRAKLICSKFNNNFDVIRTLTFDELSQIDGIGDIIASEWINYFTNSIFINELDNLLKEISFVSDNSEMKDIFMNNTFVITGSLYNFKNRDELIEYIESLGGSVVKAVSNNVNYLINNDITSTSSKNKKAHELKIPIISEEQLIEMSSGKEKVKKL